MTDETLRLPPRDIELCLHYLPTVARTTKSAWARTFALSVMKQSRRRGWNPSPKQFEHMRKLVAELFTALRDDGDDLQLIE